MAARALKMETLYSRVLQGIHDHFQQGSIMTIDKISVKSHQKAQRTCSACCLLQHREGAAIHATNETWQFEGVDVFTCLLSSDHPSQSSRAALHPDLKHHIDVLLISLTAVSAGLVRHARNQAASG